MDYAVTLMEVIFHTHTTLIKTRKNKVKILINELIKKINECAPKPS